MSKALKRSLYVLGGIVLTLVITIHVTLSCGPLTRIVNRVAAPYVEGSATIGKVKVSLFRNFPNLRLEAQDVSVIYPHGLFSQYDSLGCSSGFFSRGLSESGDTLAYAGHLSCAVDVIALIKGKLDIPKVEVSGLKAFAHQYDSTAANWNIILIPESEDSTSAGLPEISIGHINIDEPLLIYTSARDSLSACLKFRDMHFKGKLAYDGKKRSSKDRIGLELKELSAEGRTARDSAVLEVSMLDIFEHKDHIDVEMDALAELRDSSFGVFSAPLKLDTEFGLSVPESGRTAVNILALNADIAGIPISAEGSFIYSSDSCYVDGRASIDAFKLEDVLENYAVRIVPSLSEFSTDASLSFAAEAKGWFNGEKLPWMKLRLEVPESTFSYADYFKDGDFDLSLTAENMEDGKLSAEVEDFCFKIPGIDLNLKGKVDDLYAEDPLFDIDAFACTEFAELVDYLPSDSGIDARGDVDFELKGKTRLSQMSPYTFSSSSLNGHIFSDGVFFAMPADTISAFLSHSDIRIATAKGRKDGGIGITAVVDSVRMIAGASTYLMGKDLELKAQNSGQVITRSGELPPLDARLTMGSLSMMGTDSLMIGIRNSSSNITFTKTAKGKGALPRITAASGNQLVFIRSGEHRVTLQNADFSAAAQKRSSDTPAHDGRGRDTVKLKRLVAIDSIATKLDRAIPDYLSEMDFRAKDFNFELGESIVKLFREWRPAGNLSISNGIVNTPLLPLKNLVSDLKGHFSDDEISLSSIRVESGESDLSASGSIRGLRDILLGLGRQHLDIKLDLKSGNLNANELLAAFNSGGDMEDSLEVQEEQALDYSLIVIPANIQADVTLEADSVRYSTVSLKKFGGELVMRERCLQLTNSFAETNAGDISLDGFYSTKTKKNISAGFNVAFKGITSDKIITIFPAVDSLVPLLKSFKGKLDCELAATTQLDTNMNIIIPSMNGIVKMNGSGLELEDTGELRKLAQILMFKDTKVGHIQDMSLNGIISNNQLEIFPFIVGIDRYTLALKGLQQFDQNFKYHISIIHSPLPFKFGVNFIGNFDDWRYSIGKAQYKNTKIPVFTPQVDTLQVNLVASIKDIFKKGVDAAIRENNEARRHLESVRSEMDVYDDDDDELLSAEEQDELESYLIDIECEEESKRIEEEIEAMLAEELAQTTKVLMENLQNQKK